MKRWTALACLATSHWAKGGAQRGVGFRLVLRTSLGKRREPVTLFFFKPPWQLFSCPMISSFLFLQTNFPKCSINISVFPTLYISLFCSTINANVKVEVVCDLVFFFFSGFTCFIWSVLVGSHLNQLMTIFWDYLNLLFSNIGLVFFPLIEIKIMDSLCIFYLRKKLSKYIPSFLKLYSLTISQNWVNKYVIITTCEI